MDDARWRRIDALFGDALELDADLRDAFLERQCGGDEELRHAVERLLALEVEAASFLAEPLAVRSAPVPSGALDDARIGPYRLLRPLGHGGMGSVYLARREDDYRQDVAIKLVRRGLLNDDLRRRFLNERQVLARLEHPNIARLYDGGTTADGHPFLVMERIEGLPIDLYCDRHRLTIRRRLELFRQICAAVEYAHRRGLVHCDLKPSNVLVTDDGTPKLLDFGIAKLLRADELGAEPTRTLSGLRPVTPGYASPEQMSGKAITPASDVYSLGALLYKLLCGRRPYFAAKPLRGDLEAIVLKALSEEPAERYATVEELAHDVLCHLEARPVSARRGSRSYRVARWLRRLVLPADAGRRRERLVWAAAFAGTLGVSLVLVTARLALSTEETTAPPAESRSVATPLDFGASATSSTGSKSESHLAEARAAYERSDYRLELHAARRAINTARADGDELSEARALVLEAQALDVLGQPTKADEDLQEARRTFERLGARLDLAHATFALRNTVDSGRLPMSFEDALAVSRERGDRRGEALALVRIGKLVPPEERARGEAMIREALTLAEELGDLRIQAEAWSNLASLSFGREDLSLADEQFAKAVQVGRASGDASLEAGFMFNQATVRRWLGDWETHDALTESAVAIGRRIDHRYLLAMALPALAGVRSRQGDEDAAVGLYEEAKEIALGIGDSRTIAYVLEGLASSLERRAEHDRALEIRQRILEIYQSMEGQESADRAELDVTSDLLRLGRAAEAEARLRALAEKYPVDDETYEYTALLIRLKLAENALGQDKVEEAHEILAAVLPRVAAKDEAELHRLAARLAAEADAASRSAALADLLIREERAAAAEGDTERALRLRLDLGRLLWYSGDEPGARERFEEVRRRASELRHPWLAGLAAREAEELARVRLTAL